MKNVLIEFNDNWADEMDVSGFSVCTIEEWEKNKALIEAYTGEIILCIGTNEELEFDNGNDFLSHLTITEISDRDEKVITKHFGSAYGFAMLDEYLEAIATR